MAAISEFRVYAERKYQSNGEWKTEEVELGQLRPRSNTLPIPENIVFYSYSENSAGAFSTSFFPTTAYGNYCSFNPGDIYIPDKSFGLFDFFTSEEFSLWCGKMLDDFGNNINQEIYEYCFASNVFWQNPNGFNIIPILKGYLGVATYSINNDTIENITRSISFSLDFMMTKLDQTKMFYKGSYYYIKEDDGTERMLSDRSDYFCNISTSSTGIGACCGGPIYNSKPTGSIFKAHLKEFQNGLNRFMLLLSKVKFHPFWNFGLNSLPKEYWVNGQMSTRNIYMYNIPETTEQTEKSGTYADSMQLVADISNCPYFPTLGMTQNYYPSFSRISNIQKCGCVTRIDWNGGPEPNNPSETDDPNDDDPGHGNGDDPDDKGGDGDHDNTSDIIEPPGRPPLSATGIGLVSVYNPTSSQLAQLGVKLWNPTALDAIKQYFTNPMDTILGCSIIPVNPSTAETKNIHLGVYDTEVSAPLVDSDYVIINCGSIPINRYYGSYLDYDPYTKITCYLPYIGEIEVNPDQVMQKSLKVLYYVNVITGDIVAMLCADGSIIYTVAGNCIRQLPMSQSDYSAIINTAVSAVSTITSAAVGASAAGAVGGAVAGAAKTTAGAAVAEARTSAEITNQVMGAGNSLINQVMSSKMRYNHAGSIGTGSGQLTYQTPYLTIERPNLDLADSYKSFVGYPCNKTMQLSRCTGFTQIEATKLSIPGATDEEITEILQFLVEGVII